MKSLNTYLFEETKVTDPFEFFKTVEINTLDDYLKLRDNYRFEVSNFVLLFDKNGRKKGDQVMEHRRVNKWIHIYLDNKKGFNNFYINLDGILIRAEMSQMEASDRMTTFRMTPNRYLPSSINVFASTGDPAGLTCSWETRSVINPLDKSFTIFSKFASYYLLSEQTTKLEQSTGGIKTLDLFLESLETLKEMVAANVDAGFIDYLDAMEAVRDFSDKAIEKTSRHAITYEPEYRDEYREIIGGMARARDELFAQYERNR
jgi:hypothetical protein